VRRSMLSTGAAHMGAYYPYNGGSVELIWWLDQAGCDTALACGGHPGASELLCDESITAST
jgi:hypothetical protein